MTEDFVKIPTDNATASILLACIMIVWGGSNEYPQSMFLRRNK